MTDHRSTVPKPLSPAAFPTTGLPQRSSPRGPRRRTVRAVRVVPVGYSTYAPRGYTCADCKSLIGSGVRVVRLADDHIVNGHASPDYRHISCFYPKERPSKARGKVAP